MVPAVPALASMGAFPQKARKKWHKAGKTTANRPGFGNDQVKDKKCEVKSLLSHVLPPPGISKARVGTSCSSLTLADAGRRRRWQGRLAWKAGHSSLPLPKRAR